MGKRLKILKNFIQYENIFYGLETEHKQKSLLHNTGAFIKPEIYVIGPAAKDERVKGRTQLVPTDSTAAYEDSAHSFPRIARGDKEKFCIYD